MTDTINVPRELLIELRDSTNEAGNFSCRQHQIDHHKRLVMQADALLESPSQPAQVQGWQMVLPERIKRPTRLDDDYRDGWNDCIDEVARLNAAAPQPSDDVAQLRKQLDEAHALLSSVSKYLDNPLIDNWLAANPA